MQPVLNILVVTLIMSTICRFSDITNEDLEHIILDVKGSMPEVGERLTMGVLRSRGIIVPRHRVHQILHKVDPISTALWWHSKTNHKSYSVPGPNSLWHIAFFVMNSSDEMLS